MRNALSLYKRHPTTNNRIEFKKTRAKARRVFKKSNRNSWNNETSSITSALPIKLAWEKLNSINGFKKRTQIPPMNIDDNILTLDSEIAGAFVEKFAENSSHDKYSPNFRLAREMSNISIEKTLEQNTTSDHNLNTPIRPEEITQVLKNTKNSSAGPDGIPSIFLKKLPQKAINYICKLFNKILETKSYPRKWKEALVIPVPKPNKDHTKLGNYRPIAIPAQYARHLKKSSTKESSGSWT